MKEKIKQAVTHEDNQLFIRKVIWSIGGTLFVGIVSTAASIMWSTNTTNQQVTHLGLYTKENRSLIRENRKSIAEIKSQGDQQIVLQTEIATAVKYIAKENNTTNAILNKIVDKTEKTALEQASRTSAIHAIRRHVEDDEIHTP